MNKEFIFVDGRDMAKMNDDVIFTFTEHNDELKAARAFVSRHGEGIIYRGIMENGTLIKIGRVD